METADNKRQLSVVSYNINQCSQQKVDRLLAMDADVLVVPELSCRDHITLPDGYDMEWCGKSFANKLGRRSKGLGIIWRKGEGRVPEWYNPSLKYAIPLIVGDFLILAFWPTKHDPTKTYPQLAQELIAEYAPHLGEYKTLVIGDFNCYYKQFDANATYGDITNVDAALSRLGLRSVYHVMRGEKFGKETRPTYYHQFKAEQGFFIDYAYTNAAIVSYRLMDWNREMSDHVAQEIVIE